MKRPFFIIFNRRMRGLSAICMLFFFSGCISDYMPRGAVQVKGVLVVDGFITNGESVFTLRKSAKMSENLALDEETVNNALLYVECSDGTTIYGKYTEKGKYVVPTGDLDPALEYRLNFSYDGNEFQSGFLSPVITTEIDSISYSKEADGHPVYVKVSTHDPKNTSPYYRWAYKETWEVKADIISNGRMENGEWIEHNTLLRDSNNTYYCWGRKESDVLLLEATGKLAENVVYEKKLIEIPSNHDKVSVLYHVEVFQTQIRREAYDYFSYLRNAVERTGGLFSPVLSAGDQGNVYCLTDRDIEVLGYVEVATTTKKARFIEDNSLYEPLPLDCPVFAKKDFEGSGLYYGKQFAHISILNITLATCVDCRVREKASKDRPTWWPTNHY